MSEFQFPSKPIQIDQGMILLECGSVWFLDSDGNPESLYTHNAKATPRAPRKPKKVVDLYTEEFKYMWAMWIDKIPNSSVRKRAAEKWATLSEEDRTAMVYSIDPYSKSNQDPKYLMRCENYIDSGHFEGAKRFEATAKDIIPMDSSNVWDKLITNDIGIVESARKMIKIFGMSREEAFRKIKEIK